MVAFPAVSAATLSAAVPTEVNEFAVVLPVVVHGVAVVSHIDDSGEVAPLGIPVYRPDYYLHSAFLGPMPPTFPSLSFLFALFLLPWEQ